MLLAGHSLGGAIAKMCAYDVGLFLKEYFPNPNDKGRVLT
jgi:putative lipase involved disintegration of autophagic bodies